MKTRPKKASACITEIDKRKMPLEMKDTFWFFSEQWMDDKTGGRNSSSSKQLQNKCKCYLRRGVLHEIVSRCYANFILFKYLSNIT